MASDYLVMLGCVHPRCSETTDSWWTCFFLLPTHNGRAWTGGIPSTLMFSEIVHCGFCLLAQNYGFVLYRGVTHEDALSLPADEIVVELSYLHDRATVLLHRVCHFLFVACTLPHPRVIYLIQPATDNRYVSNLVLKRNSNSQGGCSKIYLTVGKFGEWHH